MVFTYEHLLEFVEKNGYQYKSFKKVIELYEKEVQEMYEDMSEEHW